MLLPALWVALIAVGSSIVFVPPALVRGEAPAAAAATGGAAGVGSADQFARRCVQCHAFEGALSHPVNVRPSMNVPDNLPLEGGLMACTTCHVAIEHNGPGGGAMLRQAVGTESLCVECHTRASEPGGRTAHATALDRAHLQERGRSSSARSGGGVARLDEESRSCMGCHDGTRASDAGSHSSSMGASREQGGEHPIGIPYQERRSGGEEIRLIASSKLDPRIRLFDRNVGCGSCHSVYSTQKQMLVMSNLRSQLCLGCHVE